MSIKVWGVLGIAACLSGCASNGPRLSSDSFPERARQLLDEQAELGPVALVNRIATLDPQSVAVAAEDGVRGIDVAFDPFAEPDAQFRLVVQKGRRDPCGSGGSGSGVLTVAFCRGSDAVATSRMNDDAADEESELAANVRRATRQIFPAYRDNGSGVGIFGVFGSGVSIGVGTSVGF